VRHAAYAPFGKLLPRAAALVHHGGIGTTAQALRAGCPQLIMPMSHDQPDNAARCRRLGVGLKIERPFFSARRVSSKLDRLLNDPNVDRSVREVSARFDGRDGIDRACDLIEGMTQVSSQ
jgi:UDP:flavonoid glycosyltransferase YjiC (YdhE family)